MNNNNTLKKIIGLFFVVILSLACSEVKVIPVVETTWKTWKEMYPGTRVVTNNTGYNRNYGYYPYGDYRTNNNNLLFSISNDDKRLPRKERVLGVVSAVRASALV